MDNIAHTLLAGAIGRAGVDRIDRWAGATLLVSANVPDLDIVAAVAGPGGYLVHHRGITHSLIGIVALAPLTAGLMLTLGRWIGRRRDRGGDRSAFGPLCLAALCGLASHLALDACNAYGIRPFLPFEASWYYNDWLAIVDPWMWLVPGLLLYWDSASTVRRHVLWGLGGAILTAIVVFSGAAADWVEWVWLGGLTIAIVGVRFRTRKWRRVPARIVLAFVPLYVVGSWSLQRAALGLARDYAPPDHRVAVLPQPGAPGDWRLVYYGEDSVFVGRLGPRTAQGLPTLEVASLDLRHPVVERAARTEPGRAMLSFARFPFARVRQIRSGWRVWLIDARYAWHGNEDWGAVVVDVPEVPGGR